MLAHIVRIDAGNTHGWQVRINSANDGSTRYASKLFSDSVHGGKRKARKLAEDFLKTELESAGVKAPVPPGRRIGMQFPEAPGRTSNANISGRNGVYRGEHVSRRGDQRQEVRYWAASYSIGPDGTPTSRSRRFYFGVRRSEETARKLAIRFREEWEQAFLARGAKGVVKFFRNWQPESIPLNRRRSTRKGK
jgi:hypothetical protein